MIRRRRAGTAVPPYGPEATAPEADPVARWQEEVHRDMVYDLEIDTSLLEADECARRILEALENPLPDALLAYR